MKNYSILVFFVFLFGLIASFNVFGATYDFGTVDAVLLNQDPDPAQPGQYVELRWKVIKLGNKLLEDVTFTLEADYPFIFDSSDSATKVVGDWQGYSGEDEYYILYYKLRVAEDAIEDTYKVKLNTKHGDGTAFTSKEYDIRVGEKQEAKFVLGNIVTSPSKLMADLDEAEIKIDIENIGDGKAQNLKAELVLPEGFVPTYSYSNQENIGTIDAGQGETAVFYIDLDDDLVGKEYPATVKLSYKEELDDDNVYKTVEIPFNIQVRSKPRFEIVGYNYTPQSVNPGDDILLTLEVKNIGDEDADSVSLRAFKESSQPFEFEEKSDYIGNLKVGETGEAVLKLSVDKDAELKDYLFDIEIRTIYRDDVLLTDKTVRMNITEPLERKSSTSLNKILIFAVPLIFALIGFFIGRAKAAKKKS